MSETKIGEKDPLKRSFHLTPKQILGISVAIALAVLLTVEGFGYDCLGVLVIAVLLYMIPQMLGVKSITVKASVGVVFLVIAVLLGGFLVAGNVSNMNSIPTEKDDSDIRDVDYNFEDGYINITATIDNLGGDTVVFYYSEVLSIPIRYSEPRVGPTEEYTLTVTGTTATGSVALDPDKLYLGAIGITMVNDEGEAVMNNERMTYSTYLLDANNGNILPLTIVGCFLSILNTIFIFFIILIFSNIMRKRLEKTREKMEQEGRLYPQGYGRCDSCGSVVLPGDVNCRKCGAYIDRPDEMKPSKKDSFECSDCGAEVPMAATMCPKCGAAFDGEETIVVHSDGTVDITDETFECSDCGAEVPMAATMCPKCGAKFEN